MKVFELESNSVRSEREEQLSLGFFESHKKDKVWAVQV